MPREKKTRACLVCETPTITAHMGIDACRACAVFYRRSKEKNSVYACRSGTSRCAAGKGLNCKKCRLAHLDNILRESGENNDIDDNLPLVLTSDCGSECKDEPSTSFSSPPNCKNAENSLSLFSRIKMAYEKMSHARLIGELFARKEPPSPTQTSLYNHPVYPATYVSINHANRMHMSCILEFGATCFPEFRVLSQDEKWSISVNFFYGFRMLENAYRSNMMFGNNPDRVDNFFNDFDKVSGDIEEAKRIMKQRCRTKPKERRAVLEKLKPDENEFFSLTSLLFWSTNGMNASDDVTAASENYRKQVFSELHLYYREVLHFDNYALRIGDLFSALPVFENNNKIKQTFEIFRLLDIFSDDSFTYTLNKS